MTIWIFIQVTYALNLHNEVKPKLNEFGRLKKEFKKRDSEAGVDTKILGKELVETLLKAANQSIEGKLFWMTDDESLSKAVEITAYNTLSLIMVEKLPEALKVKFHKGSLFCTLYWGFSFTEKGLVGADPSKSKTLCTKTFKCIPLLSGVLPLFARGTREYRCKWRKFDRKLP